MTPIAINPNRVISEARKQGLSRSSIQILKKVLDGETKDCLSILCVNLTDNTKRKVSLADVAYFHAANKKVFVKLTDQTEYLVDYPLRSLSQIEKVVGEKGFKKASRNKLISIFNATGYHSDGRQMYVEYKHEKVRCSRRTASEIKYSLELGCY